MSSSSNLSVPEDAAGSRALPSFKPARRDASGDSADKPESSASGSRRSDRSSSHDEPAAAQMAPNDLPEPQEDRNVLRANTTVRRSRPHSSGGFLLDTALHPRRAFLSRSKKADKLGENKNGARKLDIKGKRPNEQSEIILPKRRLQGVKHEKSPSIGGSPLATEIKQDTDAEDYQETRRLIAGTDVRKSTFLQDGSTIGSRHGSSLGKQRASTSVGYDTDPAQIVNMALSLNEKRRRQVSGIRTVSGQSSGTRATSGAIPPQVGHGTQFTTPTRASARFSSQTPESKGARRTSGILEQQQASMGGPVTHGDDASDNDVSFSVSNATELRVQKARTYFELAYEHRRLLSHLPPIQRAGTSLPTTHGKIYNPLQYSRNRKLRFSEKHPIASEAEGWYDVDQVREWVDKVVDADNATHHDPEECVRLPDLANNNAELAEEDNEEEGDPMLLDSPASSLRRSSVQKAAKPTRPRSDWMTHPGDLIADACWLEQGLNKLKIVDRDGNKIYPPDTRFKFSGWRNRTPVDVPERLQEPTPPPDQGVHQESLPSPPPSALPDLPTFTSTHKDKLRKRGRRRNAFKGKFAKDHKVNVFDGGSFDSSSSGDDSDDEGRTRGRKVPSRSQRKVQEGDVEDSWKSKSASDPQFIRKYESSGEYSMDRSANSSKRPSVDHTLLTKLFTRDSRTDSSRNGSKAHSDSGRRESAHAPPSRASYDGGSFPRSSAEYDTTAPTSPTGAGFPSIAINLSPPQSRSPSPSKKHLPSILNPFRDRSQNRVREGVEVNDFGKLPSRQQTRQSSNEADPVDQVSDHASRGTSPMTRGTSPMTKSLSKAPTHKEPQIAAEEHRGSTVSKISTRSAHTDGQSRVRGIFKGGRIAELVGNEVSKVGDYIWKRDVPPSVRRRDSSSSSTNSDTASGSDDEPFQNGSLYKTPPQHEKRFPSSETEAQRSTRLSPTNSHSSPESGGKVDPRYHNPNLPSFTSPFEKDRDTQDEIKRGALSPSRSPEERKEKHDHISHLAAEHRNATKSPRMDRLAPPKLNMSRSASPQPPFSMIDYDRRSSYGFGDSNRDFSKSRNASQVFNDAIKTNGNMVTGLASIRPSKSRSRSRVDLFRTVSHQSSSNFAVEVKDVSKRDIAFTSALLISSAVKAREIEIRANAVRDPLPAFLLNTIELDSENLHSSVPLRVPRKEEHIVAARNIIARLEKDSQKFQTEVQSFQSTMVPQLQMSLQALEDLVDNGLTPRVRKSGDEAGELSMKLATTSTLAIKNVNERLDAAMRRRRRGPVRWLRRFGYLCIEWVVVALLWGIWAIVTALRVVRAVVVFWVRATRWLFFL